MKKDIEEYVKRCPTCQTSKTDFRCNKSPMVITTTSTAFCEQIALDIVDPSSLTRNNNRFLLTLQDDLTKFIQVYPLPTHDAKTVAEAFLHFCTQFAFPQNVLTDQGTEFTFALFKEFNKLLSIKHKTSSYQHITSLSGEIEQTPNVLTIPSMKSALHDKELFGLWNGCR